MKKIFIAPIAGVTDYTYRGILEEFHPDLLFTEMVSSDALAALNDKTISQILRLRSGNGVQLFGKDRKSTRLNSSHANISYAVFCLKKKRNSHYHILLFQ